MSAKWASFAQQNFSKKTEYKFKDYTKNCDESNFFFNNAIFGKCFHFLKDFDDATDAASSTHHKQFCQHLGMAS